MSKITTFLILGMLVLGGIGVSAFSIKKTNTRSISADAYDMVIITPEKFVSYLQPLVDHKNNHDIQTTIKTTEAIYTEYEGRDKAEQIKYFIKDAIEQYGISYVLLIGGMKPLSFDWFVPVRYSHLNDGSGHEVFLTDLYFADIYKENGDFEDWDSNKNGVFGEWGFTGDKLDLKPDVAIGRLPCRTTDEVKTVVEKIITYENTAYGQSWFNQMVVVGGDTFPTSTGYEGEATCDVASSYMNDFTIKKLYASTGTLSGPDDIIAAVNQGCGFLLTRGRGGTDRVRMVMPEGAEFIAFDIDSISQLNNKDMYPIVVLGECIHGRFDVGIINIIKLLQKNPEYNVYDCIYECIAWSLISEKNAGAIATVTNTNICFGDIGDKDHNGVLDDAESLGGFLAVELFRLYGQEGIDTLGVLHQQALSNYVDLFPVQVHTDKYHCKSVQEFILFGDPSLKIGGYPSETG
jgi:hypothetical protein